MFAAMSALDRPELDGANRTLEGPDCVITQVVIADIPCLDDSLMTAERLLLLTSHCHGRNISISRFAVINTSCGYR